MILVIENRRMRRVDKDRIHHFILNLVENNHARAITAARKIFNPLNLIKSNPITNYLIL